MYISQITLNRIVIFHKIPVDVSKLLPCVWWTTLSQVFLDCLSMKKYSLWACMRSSRLTIPVGLNLRQHQCENLKLPKSQGSCTLHFGLNYELIYQRNAIEYLLCTFSSTCFGLTLPSSGAMDVKLHRKHMVSLM